MKVCFPDVGLGFGGSNISTIELAQALQKEADFEVSLVFAKDIPSRRYCLGKDIERSVLTLGRSGFKGWKNILWIFRYSFSVFHYLKTQQPSIVHCTNHTLIFWLIPTLFFKTRLIWNVRAMITPGFSGYTRALLYLLFCDGIIFVSKSCQHSMPFKFLLNRKPNTIIMNFVSSGPSTTQEKLNAPRPFTIGFVGRISDPVKNFERTLNIFKKLERKDIELLVWGGHNEFEQDLPNNVKIFPFDNKHLNAVYHNLDVLFMSSIREGSPRVIMEAATNGVPTVASRVGGCPELIRHRETGYCYDLDEEALRYLNELIEHPQKAYDMGQQAKKMFTAEFSLRSAIERYVNFYKNVVPGK